MREEVREGRRAAWGRGNRTWLIGWLAAGSFWDGPQGTRGGGGSLFTGPLLVHHYVHNRGL
jgi:hypothetical protein